eukprot:5384000-Pleurochrysis_carterae.AAC.2
MISRTYHALTAWSQRTRKERKRKRLLLAVHQNQLFLLQVISQCRAGTDSGYVKLAWSAPRAITDTFASFLEC